MSVGNVILGIIGLAAGAWITKEAFWLNHHVFFLAWAENKWGPGSGTLAYRWIGIALIIFSIFVIAGRIDLLSDPYSSNNSNRPTPGVQIIPSGTGDSSIAQ